MQSNREIPQNLSESKQLNKGQVVYKLLQLAYANENALHRMCECECVCMSLCMHTGDYSLKQGGYEVWTGYFESSLKQKVAHMLSLSL